METELEQLARDPLVAPARVLARKLQHEFPQRSVRRWTADPALRVRPPPAHELAMPTQKGRRRHHEPVPAPLREQSRERRDERTIGGPKPRSPLLTSQNRELMPQQHQLHVLGELGSATADEQPQDSNEGKVGEGKQHRAILPGPANALATDSSCSVQRFLISARA